MSITNYSELQTAIGNNLHRSDLSSRITEWITLCEASLNNGLIMPELGVEFIGLRVRQMETRVTATINEEYEDLPSDFLEMRAIKLNTDPKTSLTLSSPAQLDQTYAGSQTAKPTQFCLIGDTIRFGPSPDASYTAEMLYYAKIAALSASATSNWLLTLRPDIYLYGSLIHAVPYIDDDNDRRLRRWASAFMGGVSALGQADRRARWSGGPLIQRTNTGTP